LSSEGLRTGHPTHDCNGAAGKPAQDFKFKRYPYFKTRALATALLLDIDLSLKAIRHPEALPLVSKATG
jgi:hypothetical protein